MLGAQERLTTDFSSRPHGSDLRSPACLGFAISYEEIVKSSVVEQKTVYP